MASIYVIKSKTSGKCYIGQTNSTAQKRWKKHLVELRRREGCRALYSAIKKYGIEDFKIRAIKNGEFTRQELNILEKKFIKKYKTLSPLGYNLTTGGDYFEISEDTKKIKSERMKGRKVTWGDKVSIGVSKLWSDPVYRAKMVKSHSGKRGYKYKKHTKPLRRKLDIKKINELYKQGSSINKIAKELNTCWTAIQKRIRE